MLPTKERLNKLYKIIQKYRKEIPEHNLCILYLFYDNSHNHLEEIDPYDLYDEEEEEED